MLNESNGLITQNREAIITQDGLIIVTDVFVAPDLLTAQSGDFLVTQGLVNIAL